MRVFGLGARAGGLGAGGAFFGGLLAGGWGGLPDGG